jgi:signal peptidase I
MASLAIPAEHAWQETDGHRHSQRTVTQTVRSGWVWGQRALLALALFLFLTLAVLPRLGLYRPVTVLSGSMRPTFSPGDTVIVTSEPVSAVRVGQVISYQVPVGAHQVETHRVIRILQAGPHPVIQTQGDANNHPDPWTARLEGTTAWRLSAVVPHLGYVVNWLRSPILRMAAIVVVPALLALLMIFEIWGLGGGAPAEAVSSDVGPSEAKPVIERGGPWEQRLGRDRRVRQQPWFEPERRATHERRAGRRAGWTPPIHLPSTAAGQA